jgi:hypothetical protein
MTAEIVCSCYRFPFFQMNPVEAAGAAAKKQQERETLRNVIAQWNANRLDLFELSEPNEVSVVKHHAL